MSFEDLAWLLLHVIGLSDNIRDMSLHRDGWLVLANIGTLGLLAWLNWGMWANVVVFLAAFEGWCLAVQVQRSRVGDEQGERSERD